MADLVAPEARSRGYGLFYMLYAGSGAIAPVLYGWFSDAAGLSWAMILLGVLTMGAAPMAGMLRASAPLGNAAPGEPTGETA